MKRFSIQKIGANTVVQKSSQACLLIVFAVVTLALSPFASAQATHGKAQDVPNVVTLGDRNKEMHDVYSTSTTATALISFDKDNFNVGSNVFIHVKLESHVGREILVNPDGIKFQVFDSTGKVPKETQQGCLEHFFSKCYTGWLYRRKIVQIPFPSFDKIEWDKNLTKEYDLSKPGTYTVIAYVCGINTLSDCFRSNETKFTVK